MTTQRKAPTIQRHAATKEASLMPRQRTANASTTADATRPVTLGARALAVLRVAIGFTFLWAFLDKTFGLGYATTSERAWLNGGSPTYGFLSNVSVGPFESMFNSWAGAAWADWLFMLGLLGIGVAVIAGVALRIAAISGTIMMLLMWAAEWPLARTLSTGEPSMSTNPLVDYHIIYALVLIALAVTHAGNTWGFGRVWAKLPVVRETAWLR
ncbi:DoxX family membrane protein [Thermasporomyces composti]|jgi:thiosulfate dehydrogenase [quinone] large subunit|uniref:Thiosulfate dehydrogenase [quinone] large subunit n=1 Tax=Thermasporomyces composti TaxID=696763 RepID=A0A3D9VFQ1_THECX|nr:DoxX family membrane protein [Thermasporomyces composti]REF37985.1 thiosulfate dehydrogenase [quinone] large subunit [Thermasporomyces composti]